MRNLLLILGGWVLLLWVLPPAHDYPIIDDWIYAESVQHQLATGAFAMPNQSQTTLVGLTLWGTAWARLFGFSYTTLTWSVLALAIPGSLAFYGIARRVGVVPGGALLGTVLLALNPIVLHLTYSFMSDVPFLALALMAAYGYLRGLQGEAAHPAWLLGAGLLSGWGFLIRPFAILVPLGFAAYLVLDMLLTWRPRWGALLAIAVLPALIAGGWWLWAHDMPPSGATQAAGARRAQFFLREPWLHVFLLRSLAMLPLTALSSAMVWQLRVRRWWLLGVALLLVGLGWAAFTAPPETWIGTTEPPFTVVWGPFHLALPQQLNTLIGLGNIIRPGGLDFFDYRQEPIWNPEVWHALFIAATLLGVWLLAKLLDGLWDGLRSLGRRRPPAPLAGLYLAGLGIFVVTMAATGDLYDRYLVGFLAFVILFGVRGSRHWGRRAWLVSLAMAGIWALAGLLAQADAVEHDNARWQAGNWLLARAAPVHMGFDWDSIRGAGNGTYEVTDLPIPGFRTEARFPYLSRLAGGQTRYVLAQARLDMPPLPAVPRGADLRQRRMQPDP